jgi:hypothetical protein
LLYASCLEISRARHIWPDLQCQILPRLPRDRTPYAIYVTTLGARLISTQFCFNKVVRTSRSARALRLVQGGWDGPPDTRDLLIEVWCLGCGALTAAFLAGQTIDYTGACPCRHIDRLFSFLTRPDVLAIHNFPVGLCLRMGYNTHLMPRSHLQDGLTFWMLPK